MPDPLELLANIELRLVVVEVYRVPSEAENLTPAEAEDEDQDEGGVKRLAGVLGRFEEPPGVIDGPGLGLPARARRAALGHLEGGNRVTTDGLVFHGRSPVMIRCRRAVCSAW